MDNREKIDTAATWAESVRKTDNELKYIDFRLRSLDEEKDGLQAVSYDGESVKGGASDTAAAMLARLERISKERENLQGMKEAAITSKGEFARACDLLEKRLALPLMLYYYEGERWSAVATITGYSVDYIRGWLRHNALLELYEVMPIKYK